MKRMLLIAALLAIPAFAADNANKALPQDAQIKLLKAQRQLQQLQMQMSNLQRQYDDAVKQSKELQTQMGSDCAEAAKQSSVDLNKFTCDLDSLTFTPRPEAEKTAQKK